MNSLGRMADENNKTDCSMTGKDADYTVVTGKHGLICDSGTGLLEYTLK
jgi:hypothetical protein